MNLLIRPVFTEKSMADAQNSKFTFIVVKTASKDDVTQAMKEQYPDVKVLDIATVLVKGKVKRTGKKRTKKTVGAHKKAVVQLEKGQKIADFDLGEKKGK